MLLLPFIITLHLTCGAQETVIKRYRTGEMASRETKLSWPDDRSAQFKDEKVEVFNRKGDLVYHGNRRDYAGHSSVHLSYHPNGGVSRIEASSAPDAGIQWYKARYTLDGDGNITDRSEQSHDMLVTLPHIRQLMPAVVPAEKSENACATPMETVIVLHKCSSAAITVRLKGLQGAETDREYLRTLHPGDTLAAPAMVSAERFLRPEQMYACFLIDTQTGLATPLPWGDVPMRAVGRDAQHRRYGFYWVEGI